MHFVEHLSERLCSVKTQTIWLAPSPTPAVRHQAPRPSSDSGLALGSASLCTPGGATTLEDFKINNWQVPGPLRLLSLLTTSGILHHATSAITPVMCPGRVSTCNCFTSKITSPNIPFSDHILLPSSVFMYFNYDHPLTSSTFSQSTSSSSPCFFLLLPFAFSVVFCPMTSITLLEFSFAFVFLLLSISKDPSQTDTAPFVPGPRLPAIVRESHRCIRPTSNAPFKLDNSL